MKQVTKHSADSETTPTVPTKRYLVESMFILGMLGSLFLWLALITYHPSDPSWSQGETAVRNAMGQVGAWLANRSFYVFGYVAYLIPVLCFYHCLLLLRRRYPTKLNYRLFMLRTVGFILILVGASCLFSLYRSVLPSYLPYDPGGMLGHKVVPFLVQQLNQLGSRLLAIALLLMGLNWVTGLSWFVLFTKLGHALFRFVAWLFKPLWAVFKSDRTFKKRSDTLSPTHLDKKLEQPPVPMPKPSNHPNQSHSSPEKKNPVLTHLRSHALPKLSLLQKPPTHRKGSGYSKRELASLSDLVQRKLAEFNITATVVGTYPGPVITRFELALAAGIKASKLTTLARDLARGLSLSSVRIVEIIPGKPYVGLEIPNAHREQVYLSEILSSSVYEYAKSSLSLALGKDISGQPVVVNLAKMPHLLIAGTTGSGKSVSLNTMLLSLVYKNTPDIVRLIMVDPKMLELSVYNAIPHLLTPVITDMKEAVSALRWCIGEMERRYRLMSVLGVRNLTGYNHKVNASFMHKTPLRDPLWPKENAGAAPYLEILPNIIVIVDELADLIMIVGKKIEELITRLTQKARAAGIHLILATQRPSVDVITGLIKANVPARIAFQTSSRIDSRTILDQQGAEQLLGQGDMLYLLAGTEPIRVHGAFVADQEVHTVVDFLKKQAQPNYVEAVLANHDANGDNGLAGDKNNDESQVDVLFEQATLIVAQTRRASISNIQRRLKIGYNRAARILDQMEAQGMVSAMESNGSREVLLPPKDQDNAYLDKKIP